MYITLVTKEKINSVWLLHLCSCLLDLLSDLPVDLNHIHMIQSREDPQSSVTASAYSALILILIVMCDTCGTPPEFVGHSSVGLVHIWQVFVTYTPIPDQVFNLVGGVYIVFLHTYMVCCDKWWLAEQCRHTWWTWWSIDVVCFLHTGCFRSDNNIQRICQYSGSIHHMQRA